MTATQPRPAGGSRSLTRQGAGDAVGAELAMGEALRADLGVGLSQGGTVSQSGVCCPFICRSMRDAPTRTRSLSAGTYTGGPGQK